LLYREHEIELASPTKSMKPIHVFSVSASLPPELEPLRELAYNLRWAWNHDTIELFRRLDQDLWETTGHNPVALLGCIDQARLRAAAGDDSFLAHMQRVEGELQAYLAGTSTWFRSIHSKEPSPLVAYFSAEFGLTECLSIFAGGLGILAGDHLKSASDLGVPLVAVGLLYQQGYFRQYLNSAGWQQEGYVANDFHNLPLRLCLRDDGSPVVVEVAYPQRTVSAQVWKATVGRVNLYLLDTNFAANQQREDRDLTDQLYGGDTSARIRQEMMLGIGGCRALDALGLEPTVYHMNEGHSAFLALERIRRLMGRHKVGFAAAAELASASLLFTTHTPVIAGHDHFPAAMMDQYFGDYMQALGLPRKEFLALGRRNPDNENESFCMTILALKLAAFSNGVSALHGDVSRAMWQNVWPSVPANETPIGHVTNGVHFRSWISLEMNQLYDRYLGPKWPEEPTDQQRWQRVQAIPAEELWRTHERRRQRLVAFARRRLRAQLQRRGAPLAEIQAAEEALDSAALTLGFARRFATYKRATLLLRDPDRLARLLNDPKRPVQILYSGKAHPQDNEGKELIRQVVSLARRDEFRRKLVFLEDHDMTVARYMVQGVDVWLNTPLRPLEASGTSGMKAAANGALNLSTLDGWWDEAWLMTASLETHAGWAIGRGENYENRDYQDQVESEALYELLEHDVIPTFYDRGAEGLPRRWIGLQKASIANLCYFFNTHRMVQEYTDLFYLSAHKRYRDLEEHGAKRAQELAAWIARTRRQWRNVRVEMMDHEPSENLSVGDQMRASARVRLGELTPSDVRVQLCWGRLNAEGEIVKPKLTPMNPTTREGDGYRFDAAIEVCCESGPHGFTIRVLPFHSDLPSPFRLDLVAWVAGD
jgi:starch phosphorylase